jgi:hypothetical protein
MRDGFVSDGPRISVSPLTIAVPRVSAARAAIQKHVDTHRAQLRLATPQNQLKTSRKLTL